MYVYRCDSSSTYGGDVSCVGIVYVSFSWESLLVTVN